MDSEGSSISDSDGQGMTGDLGSKRTEALRDARKIRCVTAGETAILFSH